MSPGITVLDFKSTSTSLGFSGTTKPFLMAFIFSPETITVFFGQYHTLFGINKLTTMQIYILSSTQIHLQYT